MLLLMGEIVLRVRLAYLACENCDYHLVWSVQTPCPAARAAGPGSVPPVLKTIKNVEKHCETHETF